MGEKIKELRTMAELERLIAEKIRTLHPHYFMQDNHAAWGAAQAADLRAEALDDMADYEERRSSDWR